MLVMIVLIIIVCLIGSHEENKGKDDGKAVRGSKSSKGSARKRNQRSVDCNSTEISSYAHALVSEYNKAYDSHKRKELEEVVEELIGYHYSCASSHNLDDCIALEIAAKTRPYVYKGTRSDCQGLTLIEIYRKQNARLIKI